MQTPRKTSSSSKIGDGLIILSIHQYPVFGLFSCEFTDSRVEDGGIFIFLMKLHIYSFDGLI